MTQARTTQIPNSFAGDISSVADLTFSRLDNEGKLVLARAIDRVLDAAGGPTVLAGKLGITPTAISLWRKRIPLQYLYRLEVITGIPAQEMRPDVFEGPLPLKEREQRRRFKSREERLLNRVVL